MSQPNLSRSHSLGMQLFREALRSKTIITKRALVAAAEAVNTDNESFEPPTRGKKALAIDDIARVCHEACRAAAAADGDTDRPTWADAPEWQKDTTRKGVRYIQEHPDAPAGALHQAWIDEKKSDGWVYGKVKDAEKKTHPMMIPYTELPLIEKVKDHLIATLTRALS